MHVCVFTILTLNVLILYIMSQTQLFPLLLKLINLAALALSYSTQDLQSSLKYAGSLSYGIHTLSFGLWDLVS